MQMTCVLCHHPSKALNLYSESVRTTAQNGTLISMPKNHETCILEKERISNMISYSMEVKLNGPLSGNISESHSKAANGSVALSQIESRNCIVAPTQSLELKVVLMTW